MEQHSRTPRAGTRRRGARSLAGACALIGALAALGGTRAAAQEVGGQVVAASSLEPLAGAQVVARGTSVGAVTGRDGRFVLRGLTGTEVELQVQMLGYRTLTRRVPVGTMDVRFELPQAAIALNEAPGPVTSARRAPDGGGRRASREAESAG